MEKEIRNVLIITAVVAVVFWIVKPKKKVVFSKDLSKPSISNNPEKEYENAVTAIKAMREAINQGNHKKH